MAKIRRKYIPDANPRDCGILRVKRGPPDFLPPRPRTVRSGSSFAWRLEKARSTDPRLTREFLRVCGFTAAHALLCIERRERTDSGHIVATLEDYEATADVVRELSTLRQFSRSAHEVWDAVNAVFNETRQPVTASMVAKRLLKSQPYVRSIMNSLMQGGALLDARERPTKTAPLEVKPSADSPVRMTLPSAEELAKANPPDESSCERDQPMTAHKDSSHMRGEHSHMRVSPLKGGDLASVADNSGGGNGQGTDPKIVVDASVYAHKGESNKVGDQLPNGQYIETIDNGIPTTTKRPPRGAEFRKVGVPDSSPEPEAVEVGGSAGVPFFVTTATRNRLRDLGWSDRQIDGMPPRRANEIAESGEIPGGVERGKL